MTYTIKTDNNNITIPDDAVDNSTSISLIGQNASTDSTAIAYNENFLHLLEHFASNTPPRNPTKGQLWLNSSTNRLSVYMGDVWKAQPAVTISTDMPMSGQSNGDLWLNILTSRLNVWFVDQWYLLGGDGVTTDIIDSVSDSSTTNAASANAARVAYNQAFNGDLSSIDATSLVDNFAQNTTNIIAGDGLTGGGTLDDDITLSVKDSSTTTAGATRYTELARPLGFNWSGEVGGHPRGYFDYYDSNQVYKQPALNTVHAKITKLEHIGRTIGAKVFRNWQVVTPPNDDYYPWDSVWCPSIGKFLILYFARMGSSVNTYPIRSSSDGLNWTSQFVHSTSWTGNYIEWSDELGLAVCIGYTSGDGFASLITSPDGITWTPRSTPIDINSPREWAGISWINSYGRFFAYLGTEVGAINGVKLITSSDGINWTVANLPFTATLGNGISSVAYNPFNGLLYASVVQSTAEESSSPLPPLIVSSDGINWSYVTGLTFNNSASVLTPTIGSVTLRSLYYHDALGFLKYGDYHSFDGVVWNTDFHNVGQVNEHGVGIIGSTADRDIVTLTTTISINASTVDHLRPTQYQEVFVGNSTSGTPRYIDWRTTTVAYSPELKRAIIAGDRYDSSAGFATSRIAVSYVP